ncbi:MAG: 3-hydroxyanthranilate 3,4-dioxygenase [Deltaproteobacteria bacterium]|nr:MAG: 3-hydroxyanthranilate 3,4-dioxygenase [Deltaproteobacteria bacterium]
MKPNPGIEARYDRIQKPFNFQGWIEEHRHLLKPPVGNKVVFRDSNFIVMVVGGPNERTDFHINQTDEFFYQLEGNIFLKTINAKGKFEDIHIKEGEIFMLPAGVPHSPQRSEGSVGLVVEKSRVPEDTDGLQWYCKECNTKLYEEFFYLEDIEKQFGGAYERYFGGNHNLCKRCGCENGRTWQ